MISFPINNYEIQVLNSLYSSSLYKGFSRFNERHSEIGKPRSYSY